MILELRVLGRTTPADLTLAIAHEARALGVILTTDAFRWSEEMLEFGVCCTIDSGTTWIEASGLDVSQYIESAIQVLLEAKGADIEDLDHAPTELIADLERASCRAFFEGTGNQSGRIFSALVMALAFARATNGVVLGRRRSSRRASLARARSSLGWRCGATIRWPLHER